MNYEALLAGFEETVVKVGLVGAGDFGASLLAQARRIPNMDITVLCDTNEQQMEKAIVSSGADRSKIKCVTDMGGADAADFDVLVEATGNPVAATSNALRALRNKQHVVMVSKEAAILIGPMLAHLAREQGLVYTEVEGDQPSLLIGLVSWARTLGLEVRAAGKSSEYDFVLEDDDTLNWRGQRFSGCGLRDLWASGSAGWPSLVAMRQAAVDRADVPTRTVPDYCEMGVVSNATGLVPDIPGLHAPVLRPVELADALQLTTEGGLLGGNGRIDVFNCLRRSDEASMAGGVFIIVSCEDQATWEMLREKGHVVAANGKTAMLCNPQHLLGVEAPITILSAALLGLPTGAARAKPEVDLIARTSKAFKAGDVLTITDAHHHEVAGLAPELIPAVAIGDGQPCPYYLAVGQVLREDVAPGTVLTCDMLELDQQSDIWTLRRQQDTFFKI